MLKLLPLPATKLEWARRMSLPLALLKLQALQLLMKGAEVKLMSWPNVAGMALAPLAPLAANTKLSLLALLPGVPGDDAPSSSAVLLSLPTLRALPVLALLPAPTMAGPAAAPAKALGLLTLTVDAREGLAAFNAKRKPVWTGR